MPAQCVAGYGICISIYVNGHCGDRPLCTCKRPGHAVDEAIRSAHVIPALRELDVGPIAHRGGGVAFTTAIARRHECRMAGGVRSFRDWRCSGHHMVVRRGTPFARHLRRGPAISGESRHDEISTRQCAVARSTPKQVCEQVCDGVIEPMCKASQRSIVLA